MTPDSNWQRGSEDLSFMRGVDDESRIVKVGPYRIRGADAAASGLGFDNWVLLSFRMPEGVQYTIALVEKEAEAMRDGDDNLPSDFWWRQGNPFEWMSALSPIELIAFKRGAMRN